MSTPATQQQSDYRREEGDEHENGRRTSTITVVVSKTLGHLIYMLHMVTRHLKICSG